MIIAHNLNAAKILYYSNINEKYFNEASLKLSSGLRINSAKDDPAGLGISERMKAQIRGLNASKRNLEDGFSMLQTAEGGLNEAENILQRMNELAVQAANGTNCSLDRNSIKDELKQLEDEVKHISVSINFNGIDLLSASSHVTIQGGPNSSPCDFLNIDMSYFNIGSSLADIINGTKINVDTPQNAKSSISVIQQAINSVSRSRAEIGSYENRIDFRINNLENEECNLTSSYSRITDVDMAEETMEYFKYSILSKASDILMAQALQEPKQVLKLLQMS
ncbi:flagellin [Clostridium acetobutylicum]|nr:flagellin [Clostridium acetobutylicum]